MRKIFVYGVPSGGVFGLRQLRKEWPDSMIFVIAPRTDVGYYSKVYDRFYEASTKDQVNEVTRKAYQDIGGGEVYAYVYSNRMLEYMMDGNATLFDILHFENPYETYRIIVDKTQADKLCRQLGLSRPDEFPLDNLQSDDIKFPVVVKPLRKQKATGASKCEFVNSIEELETYMGHMHALTIQSGEFVCQQAITGDNRYEYGYGGFFRDGQPLVDICFHQFRQRPQGLCCYVREMTDKALAQQIRHLLTPLLTSMSYNGFMEVDIKQDQETGILYVLDINPRPWGSADMLQVKLGQSTVFHPHVADHYVVWKKWPVDLFLKSKTPNLSRHLCRKLTGNTGFRSVHALFNRNDVRPFLASCFNYVLLSLLSFKNKLLR